MELKSRNFELIYTLASKLNLLLQRVTQAAVLINKQETARIGQGLLIMVGFTDQDTIDTSFRATKKNYLLCIIFR